MQCLTALLVLGLVSCVIGTEVICYWASWTSYRTGNGRVAVEDLDPSKCTIYIYAFATLNEQSLTMEPFDTHLDIDKKGYEKFVALKERNPRLRVLLAVGGYTDSGPKYSRMLASASNRAEFVRRAVALLLQYGFDGLDLDYEYPTAADKPHFASLVAELKRAFRPHDLWLSTATPATRDRIDEGFDVPAIAAAIDMIHVMVYDLHGSWERTADHHAPLRPRESDAGRGFDVDSTVRHWLRRGAPAAKLALGVPLYGRSWTVPGPDKRPAVAAASGAGTAGPYSREAGTLTYLEICENVQDGWNVVPDASGKTGPYAYSGDQWVGYDDPDMAAKKTRYAVSRGLGAVMVWDVGSEDVRDACGGGPWPMLNAINANLERDESTGGGRPTPARPGATQRPAGTTAAPAGTTAAPAGTTAAPAGTTAAPAGTTAAPAGTTAAPAGTTAAPAGTTAAPATTTAVPRATTTVRTASATGRFSCPRDGVFVDPEDCTRFYVCSSERRSCPEGTAFSARSGTCQRTVPECPAVNPSTAQTTTTRRPVDRFACPRRNGLFADPYSCRRFFVCVNGKAKSSACPAATGWDSRISACNWLYNIDCRN